MKRKIHRSIFITGFVAALLMSLLTLYAFYGFFVNQTKSGLHSTCSIIKNSIEQLPDNESYLKKIEDAASTIRLTLVKPDGTVSFDSSGNPQSMPNHNQRKEIIEARENGFGEEIRYSETVGKNTIYYAFYLNDGYVLRGAESFDNITSVFLNILPIIFGITIALLIISLFVSQLLTKRLMRPIDELASHIRDEDGNETAVSVLESQKCYDELMPLINKMTGQKQKIKEQMASLRRERDTIQAITDNMQEGMIFADKRQKILTVNKSAVAMLNGNTSISYKGTPIFSLIADEKLNQKLDCALERGDRVDTTLVKENIQCRFFINPVYEADEIVGAIMVILDITETYKAEQIRREFSSNVSHELKTPLTSISGFAEMIENDLVSDKADTVRFAGKIHKEATRLLALIEDIIRLTEIDERAGIEMEQTELLKLCKANAENLAFSAQEKSVELIVLGDSSKVNVNINLVNELLYNLIDNAIKYNKIGGKVEITVMKAADEGLVKLSVHDNGIGIAPEHLDRIFERFYRVDKSRSKQNGGTGLGLSIVKHIAAFHGAKLSVESKEDLGTTITVEFHEADSKLNEAIQT